MRDDRIIRKNFISGSQATKDQEKNHRINEWTVLKKTSEEPVYTSLWKQPENKSGVRAFNESPFQSYRASPAVWNPTVLPATRHR